MGAPSMVGAKLRISAYNNKNKLRSLFSKIYTKSNLFHIYFKNNFKSNTHIYRSNLTPTNRVENNYYTKNLINSHNLKKTSIDHKYNINKFTDNIFHNFFYKINKKNNTNSTNNNYKKTHTTRNTSYKSNTKNTANKIYDNTKFFKLFHNYDTEFHRLYSSKNTKNHETLQKNISNLFKNSTTNNKNELSHNFILNSHKNKILNNITTRKTNKSDGISSNLNFSHKTSDEIGRLSSTPKNEEDYFKNSSTKKIDLHEIMNFVESELNQSLRSPPSGSLMSWVQSVPSYPGLHI